MATLPRRCARTRSTRPWPRWPRTSTRGDLDGEELDDAEADIVDFVDDECDTDLADDSGDDSADDSADDSGDDSGDDSTDGGSAGGTVEEGAAGEPDEPPAIDDPELADLADACFEGSGEACDDLFFQSPVDSEAEDYGDTCGGRFDESPGPCSEAIGG